MRVVEACRQVVRVKLQALARVAALCAFGFHDYKQESAATRRMRGQVKIVAYATLRKLTVTVLGVKNHHYAVGLPVYIKLSVSSTKCSTESAHTIRIHATSKDINLHETVTFNLSTLRCKRLTIEVWSSSVSPNNFVGCTSFGLRKLTESSRIVQGSYHLLHKDVGYRKHLSVKSSTSSHVSITDTLESNLHSYAWNKRRRAYTRHGERLLEHKEISIPVSILQAVKYGCINQSPPTIVHVPSELHESGLRRRDVVLSLDGAVVSLHTNAEFQNLLRSLNDGVRLKIQRINGLNTRHDKSVSSLSIRKRKLQRRPVLQRKKCRTATKDIPPESAKESSNCLTSEGNGVTSLLESSAICPQRVQEYLHKDDTSSNGSHGLTNSSNAPGDDKSNEFQLCTARFTYGRSLQKSAKIVRRRTVHNKVQDEEVEKPPATRPSPFLRKTKGRRSFVLRELSDNVKDKITADDDLDHSSNIGTLRAAFLSASEADLRKPKRHSPVKTAFRFPFTTQKENDPSKTNQPEYDKLRKLFRKRSRKLKDEKYPSNNQCVTENSDEVFHPDTLMSVLREKGKCANFRSFLAMEHSEENIAFWLDCESYKNKKISKRRKAADAIFRKFIQSGAENEVNITAEIRLGIQNGIQCPTQELFLEAQEYIYRLMESDPYRRFIKRRN